MATMVTNNSKLLSTKNKRQKKPELVERLMEMDQENLEAMLKLMG
jgi:antitoxin component of MazEF toxin-antitoxin module